MLEPCGNTQAEIERDQPIVLTQDEWELRHEERQRKLNRRKEFIKTLLEFKPFIERQNYWTLDDAISLIESESFWIYKPLSGSDETVQEYWDNDPLLVCAMFLSGDLNQFKSLIQHEVEALADMLDGKL